MLLYLIQKRGEKGPDDDIANLQVVEYRSRAISRRSALRFHKGRVSQHSRGLRWFSVKLLVKTDHQALTALHKKFSDPIMERWVNTLPTYHFEMQYVPGTHDTRIV